MFCIYLIYIILESHNRLLGLCLHFKFAEISGLPLWLLVRATHKRLFNKCKHILVYSKPSRYSNDRFCEKMDAKSSQKWEIKCSNPFCYKNNKQQQYQNFWKNNSYKKKHKC